MFGESDVNQYVEKFYLNKFENYKPFDRSAVVALIFKYINIYCCELIFLLHSVYYIKLKKIYPMYDLVFLLRGGVYRTQV